jgi:hypothetical protein
VPTRREIALGRNLVVNTQRLNQTVFAISQVLQGKDPTTGEPSGASVNAIKASVESLMIGTNSRLQMMNKFISNYSGSASVESSLTSWDEAITDFNSELLDFSATKTAIDNSLASLTTPQELSSLGATIEKPQRITATGEPLFPPDVVGRLTIVNGVLDAIKYELRGISETTGQASGKDFDAKADYSRSGIQVAQRELAFVNTSESLPVSFGISKAELDNDFTDMQGVVNYLEQNIDIAKTDKDLESLADYIDAHLSEQPCIRRHWKWQP